MADIFTPVPGNDILAAGTERINQRELNIEAKETVAAGDNRRMTDYGGVAKVEKIFSAGVGGNVITFGSENVFVTEGISKLSMCKLDTNKYLIIWVKSSGTNGAAIVATVIGDTISYGTEVAFHGGAT